MHTCYSVLHPLTTSPTHYFTHSLLHPLTISLPVSADATPLALLCEDQLPRRVGLVMGSEHEGVAPEILQAAQTVSDSE